MSVRTRLFLNNPADAVEEMLEGYAAAHSDVIRLSDGMVVRATPKPEGQVGVVIGNGSGPRAGHDRLGGRGPLRRQRAGPDLLLPRSGRDRGRHPSGRPGRRRVAPGLQPRR